MKGFTLIEFILVIVIIGVLAAVSLPAFNSAYNSIKLEGVYRQLMQDIKYTRQLAAAKQVIYGISFNPLSDTYFAYRQDISNVIKDPATNKPLSVSFAAGKFSGIDFAETTFILPSSDRLEFNSLGAPIGAGAVTISYNGVIKTITVEENTGRVY